MADSAATQLAASSFAKRRQQHQRVPSIDGYSIARMVSPSQAASNNKNQFNSAIINSASPASNDTPQSSSPAMSSVVRGGGEVGNTRIVIGNGGGTNGNANPNGTANSNSQSNTSHKKVGIPNSPINLNSSNLRTGPR